MIYSKLVYGILSKSKNSHGNKVTLERIIKRAWRVISYGNLDICKSLLNFESMFSYFIEVKFYLDCETWFKMQDSRHEHRTRFSVCNYNVPFILKVSVTNHFCISLSMYGIVYLFILQNCDSLKPSKDLSKEYLLTC